MQPGEFWDTTPHDFWLEFDMRYKTQANLTKAAQRPGQATADDFAFAREVHRKKKAAAKAAKA